MSDDNRKYRRVPIRAVVIYKIMDHIKVVKQKLRKIGNPLSIDISMGGLQIITHQKLPLGIPIKIDLSLQSPGTPLEIIGKVAWIDPDDTPGQYKTGIAFTNYVSENNKILIKKYIEMKM